MTRRFSIVIAMVLGALIAVTALMGAGRLLAEVLASDTVPEIVNYQGYLTNPDQTPVSGTVTLEFSIWDASTDGSQIWNETHNNVPVIDGYFSVFLGSQGTPLTPSVFSSTTRYLEVTFGATTFARLRFGSVPYALVAQRAGEAITSTVATNATFALTATYAMSAPSSSGGGVDWSHVVVVAKSGGDYTTVTEAMNAITPSSSDRYLILVMPGVYEEQVTVKEYVHLKGAGVATTMISAAATDGNVNNDPAATMIVPANAQVSDLTVRNTSNTNGNVGIKVKTPNKDTILSYIRVEVITSGGNNHRGIYLTGGNDNPKLTHVYIEVSDGSAQNWGIFSSASAPIIHDSTIMASDADAVGMRFNGGGATITDSTISGTNGSTGKGINTSSNGDDITIDRSSILGDVAPSGSSLSSTDVYNFRIGASRLQGDVDVTPANITCAQSYISTATTYTDLVCP